MATLGPLYPDSDISIGGALVNAAGGTASFQDFNDDPGTGMPDADYVHENTTTDGTTVSWFGLENVPADFDSMDTFSIDAYCNSFSGTHEDDTYLWTLQVFDSTQTTAYTTELTVFQTNGTSVLVSGLTTSGDILTAAGSTASATDWNNARLRLSISYTKTKGADNLDIALYAVEFNGTYTPTVTGTTFNETITLAADLDKALTNNKIANPSETFSFALNTQELASAIINDTITHVIDAAITEDVTTIYNPSFIEALNVSTTQTGGKNLQDSITFLTDLSTSQTYTAILEKTLNVLIDATTVETATSIVQESISFAIASQLIEVLGKEIIFDDPVYSVSASEYIFEDLTNFILSVSTIKTGNITFNTGLSDSVTVAWNATATQTFVTDLIESADGAKIVSITEVEDFDLSDSETRTVNATKNITFTKDLTDSLQTSAERVATLTFTAEINESVSRYINVPKTVQVSMVLSTSQLRNLITSQTVNFNSDLATAQSAQATLNETLTLLANLSQDQVVGFFETLVMSLGVSETNDPQGIFNTTLQLASNYNDNLTPQAAYSATVNLLQNHSISLSKYVNFLETFTFILDLADVDDPTITIEEAVSLVIDLAEQRNVAVDYDEAVTLVASAVLAYNTELTTNANLLFDLSTDQDALVGIFETLAISLALSEVPDPQVQYLAALTLAAEFNNVQTGDTTGFAEAILTTGFNVSETLETAVDYTATSQFNIEPSTVADRNKITENSATFNFDATDTGTADITIEKLVELLVDVQDTNSTQVNYTPEMVFDLLSQVVETPNVDYVKSLALQFDTDIQTERNRITIDSVSLDLGQDFTATTFATITGEISIDADVATALATVAEYNLDVTLGQALGLETVRGIFAERNISIDNVISLNTAGTVLELTAITPDSRIYKIYLEDRTTVIDEENRVIKVYARPSNIIIDNN